MFLGIAANIATFCSNYLKEFFFLFDICFGFWRALLSLSENKYLFNCWRCEQGLIPLQDSIEGCVECINDSDCQNDQFCEVNWVGKSANRFKSHKCKPKHKPCEPSPCGKWTCMVIDEEEVCRFLFAFWKKLLWIVFC